MIKAITNLCRMLGTPVLAITGGTAYAASTILKIMGDPTGKTVRRVNPAFQITNGIIWEPILLRLQLV